jgi:hypothetical protein
MSRIGRPTILVVEYVNRFLRGWGAYFRHGNSTQQFAQLGRFVLSSTELRGSSANTARGTGGEA